MSAVGGGQGVKPGHSLTGDGQREGRLAIGERGTEGACGRGLMVTGLRHEDTPLSIAVF